MTKGRGWVQHRALLVAAVKRPRSVARRSFAERVKCVLGTWCVDGLGLVVGRWVTLELGSLRVGVGLGWAG
jgi:hypothetical protein